jgi:hypothetical protein
MTTSTRLLTRLGLLAACLATLAALCPGQLADLMPIRRGRAPAQPDWESQRRARAQMQRQTDVLLARVKAKEEVIQQLVAGQLTLFEAAAWFGHLNQNPPELASTSTRMFPGRSPEEKLCRQVIHWAEQHLRATTTDSHTQELICRLEDDLATHLAEHGRVVLPEV